MGKKRVPPFDSSRRRFIAGLAAAGAAGSLAAGCGSSGSDSSPAATATGAGLKSLPDPDKSDIDHIVVVMMENRSYDHFLGWVPNSDGVQAGVSLKDSGGTLRQSYDLAPHYQNANLADPDHSYEGGRTEINSGAMDGFLLTQPPGDAFPIGYYTADSVPFFKGCADNWTICDRYFCSILASTTPNRIYMHAGQTDRLSNTVDISTLPTVWDRMLEKGRSVAYYYTDVPYTSFWGNKYNSFSKKYDMASFVADIASGNLADLTYVDNVGNTINEGSGISMDDHPYADIRNGQAFLNTVYNALRQSPKWDKTLVIINYDEWGGFYDHVPPPMAPVSAADAAAGNDGRLGCRVPCVLIGPRAKRGHVDHTQFDHNSVLNFIAWRFGFDPLGARASSINIAHALDLHGNADTSSPSFDVPAGPFGGPCLPIGSAAGADNPATTGTLPISPLPVEVCVPVPLPVQTPPLPGLDVPLPSASDLTPKSAEARRVDHEQELDEIRALARGLGFN